MNKLEYRLAQLRSMADFHFRQSPALDAGSNIRLDSKDREELLRVNKLSSDFTSIPYAKRFFKYQAINDLTLNALRENQIWLAKRSELNDPFDAQLKIIPLEWWYPRRLLRRRGGEIPVSIFNVEKRDGQHTLTETEVKASDIGDEFVDFTLSTLHNGLETTLSTIGICSVSKTPNSLQMWAYYAAHNSGMCLFFIADDSLLSDKHEEGYELLPVAYSDSYPRIRAAKFLKAPDSVYKTVVLTKEKRWEHEDEWRLLHPYKQGLTKSPFRLSAVAFGVKASAKDKERVVKTLEDRNDILFLQAFPAQERFGVVFWPTTARLVSRFDGIDYSDFANGLNGRTFAD